MVVQGTILKTLTSSYISELLNSHFWIKYTHISEYGRDIICGIWNGTFEIPHKISYPYTFERYDSIYIVGILRALILKTDYVFLNVLGWRLPKYYSSVPYSVRKHVHIPGGPNFKQFNLCAKVLCCRLTCELFRRPFTLQWRHNERDGVSNTGVSIVCSTVCSGAGQRKHQCSVSLVFSEGNPPVTGGFPSQRASYAENVSI